MQLLPIRRAILCALVVATAGCASVKGVTPDATPSDSQARNLLTSAELRKVETLNAYEAIRRLQPRWLTGRGQAVLVSPAREGPRVYLDGMYHGEMAILKRMSVRTIQQIRFLSSGQATLRYGTGHADGAFEVSTRRGFRAR